MLGTISSATEKTYRATARLGAESDTDDRDGTISERENVQPPKKADVQARLKGFVGTFRQTPPIYSSKKIGGIPAHRHVRKGQSVELEAREVTVHSIDLRSYAWPLVHFDVTCSSGTYIRAIARDLGKALGTGAYLEALERTAVGFYTLKQACTLEELSMHAESFLLPIPRH